MADWEDEDFGVFESADIASQTLEQTISDQNAGNLSKKSDSQSGILSWIIANSPKSNDHGTAVVEPESELSPTPDKDQNNAVERDASPFQTDGWSLQRGTTQQGTDSDSSTNPIVTTASNHPSDSVDLFASFNPRSSQTVFLEAGDMPQTNLKSALPQVSPGCTESENAIKALSAEEPRIEKKDDNAILELTAKLDAMALLKKQTEKSLENVQEELKKVIQQTNEDLEKKKIKHKEELETIHAQHQGEMKQLQTTSEETINVISQQYNTMWNEFVKQENLEKESNACAIVEKCISTLDRQKEFLSEKMLEDHAKSENKIQEIIQQEREKINDELKKRMMEEKQKLEMDMKESLKEEMKKHAKCMEEIHLSTLKEAMAKQQENFEKVMQDTLKLEREKFSEVLKNVVEETQKSTEKSMEARRKAEEARNRNQTMAVKMLLTSALGHLEQKDESSMESETNYNSTLS